MDLGSEAFGTYKALQGGCSQIQASVGQIVVHPRLKMTQFFNDVDDLK
jgi:hypothetical protein